MSLDLIVEDALTNYWHPSGMLGHPGTKLDNDNPILQLAVFIGLLHDAGVSDVLVNLWATNAIEHDRVAPGIWRRAEEKPNSLNSKDNELAVAVLQTFGVGTGATDMTHVGDELGWDFDNTGHAEGLAAVMQPGDVATVKVCANHIPQILESGHLVIGGCILAFQGMSFRKQLGWLRAKAFRIQLLKHSEQSHWRRTNSFLSMYLTAHDLSARRYVDEYEGCYRYYDQKNHPIRKTIEHLRSLK